MAQPLLDCLGHCQFYVVNFLLSLFSVFILASRCRGLQPFAVKERFRDRNITVRTRAGGRLAPPM